MSTTWQGERPPPARSIGMLGWLLVFLRGLPLGVLVFGGLILLLLIRAIERPFFGMARPVTPYLTVFVCRNALRIIGIGFSASGQPMVGQGAVVANHSSWLDIFVLNASKRIYFVSKSEVAAWPGIGWLARATGTLFIERNRNKAAEQSAQLQSRLQAGHKLLFFPEGTSSDGQRVLPFKSSLFAAFFSPELREVLSVQPVTVTYQAPDNADPRFYGWWGDMDFGSHFLWMLATPHHGAVKLTYHMPLKVSEFQDRKALTAACEQQIRSVHLTG